MAQAIRIKTGPLPPDGRVARGGPRTALARSLAAMTVGQYVTHDRLEDRSRWSAVASYWAEKLGRRYECRLLPDGGFGIWRTE